MALAPNHNFSFRYWSHHKHLNLCLPYWPYHKYLPNQYEFGEHKTSRARARRVKCASFYTLVAQKSPFRTYSARTHCSWPSFVFSGKSCFSLITMTIEGDSDMKSLVHECEKAAVEEYKKEIMEKLSGTLPDFLPQFSNLLSPHEQDVILQMDTNDAKSFTFLDTLKSKDKFWPQLLALLDELGAEHLSGLLRLYAREAIEKTTDSTRLWYFLCNSWHFA